MAVPYESISNAYIEKARRLIECQRGRVSKLGYSIPGHHESEDPRPNAVVFCARWLEEYVGTFLKAPNEKRTTYVFKYWAEKALSVAIDEGNAPAGLSAEFINGYTGHIGNGEFILGAKLASGITVTRESADSPNGYLNVPEKVAQELAERFG